MTLSNIMDFTIKLHRHAGTMIQSPEFEGDWLSLKKVIENISDNDIIKDFEDRGGKYTSISPSINRLLKLNL